MDSPPLAPENVAQKEAERLHEHGIAMARQGRFDEAAAQQFQAAIDADPDRVEAIRHLAQACADAGRLSESEAAWVRYIEKCPEVADAHRHLGNLRKRMEKFEPAIESLQKAVGLETCYIRTMNRAGQGGRLKVKGEGRDNVT